MTRVLLRNSCLLVPNQNSISDTLVSYNYFLFFGSKEAGKFKAMVNSLQKVLLQRCDNEGNYWKSKTFNTFK